MSKHSLKTDDFTENTGAYSHDLKVDVGNSEMIFVTGRVAMDAEGKAVPPDYIAAQTEYIFQNIAKSKPVNTLVEINKIVKEGCDIEIAVKDR